MQPRGDLTYVVTSLHPNTKSITEITVLLSCTWTFYAVISSFPLIYGRGRSSEKKYRRNTSQETNKMKSGVSEVGLQVII